MRLTPIDIQQHRFKSRLFGYDSATVDQYLESVAEELERLQRQNIELKESLARTRSTVDQLRAQEGLLQQTLVSTQQMTEELREQARKDAEIVIAEAHIEGERIVRNANERRMQLINDIQELKRMRQFFKNNMRSLVKNHMQLLDIEPDVLSSNALEYMSGDIHSLLTDESSATNRTPR